MALFQSTKLFKGYSCVFRQHAAQGTHCRFLHGYAVSFKIWFQGTLDDRNWVWDFGGMKRAKTTIEGKSPSQWFDYMFDHTVVVAKDDPHLDYFKQLKDLKLAQLRVVNTVGAEAFAKLIFQKVSRFVSKETNDRVNVFQVEFFENDCNSAIFRLPSSNDLNEFQSQRQDTKIR